MIRARDLLLHPIALVAIAVLIVNDHVLKAAYPSWLTGKLSDAAGLAFFPLLLLVAADRWAPRTWTTVGVAILIAALGFTLVKVWPPATALYRTGLGTLQWPGQALAAIVHGGALPSRAPVEAVTDPSDLLALPCTALAAVVARARGYVDAALGWRAGSCYNRR